MRILVIWGSRRGGTEGIARMIGDELSRHSDLAACAGRTDRLCCRRAVLLPRSRRARAPLPTAVGFVLTVIVLDLAVVSGLIRHDLAMVRSVPGFWLPLALIFIVTWTTGALMSTMPWSSPREAPTGGSTA